MKLKNAEQMDALRESGRRLERVMMAVKQIIAPGVKTAELDRVAEKTIFDQGCIPIFKGYGAEFGLPFPASICSSINDEVVHGIPSEQRSLREGDLVKIDMGLRFDGMVTDMARTFAVGNVSSKARKLMTATEESLFRGIRTIQIGKRLSDYGRAVQKYIEKQGFSVVRDLVGHGVGFELHEPPQIPNYAFSGSRDEAFCAGMAVALEPMVNIGTHVVRLGPDGWAYLTADGSLSAHFEDTVIITDTGIEVVTRSQWEG